MILVIVAFLLCLLCACCVCYINIDADGGATHDGTQLDRIEEGAHEGTLLYVRKSRSATYTYISVRFQHK
jgi:hypothetical protein